MALNRFNASWFNLHASRLAAKVTHSEAKVTIEVTSVKVIVKTTLWHKLHKFKSPLQHLLFLFLCAPGGSYTTATLSSGCCTNTGTLYSSTTGETGETCATKISGSPCTGMLGQHAMATVLMPAKQTAKHASTPPHQQEVRVTRRPGR